MRRPVRGAFRTTLCHLKASGLDMTCTVGNGARCGFVRVLSHFRVGSGFNAGGHAGQGCGIRLDGSLVGALLARCGLLRLGSCHGLPGHGNCHGFCLGLTGVVCLVGCGVSRKRTPCFAIAISRLTGRFSMAMGSGRSQGGGIADVLGNVGGGLREAGFRCRCVGKGKRG